MPEISIGASERINSSNSILSSSRFHSPFSPSRLTASRSRRCSSSDKCSMRTQGARVEPEQLRRFDAAPRRRSRRCSCRLGPERKNRAPPSSRRPREHGPDRPCEPCASPSAGPPTAGTRSPATAGYRARAWRLRERRAVRRLATAAALGFQALGERAGARQWIRVFSGHFVGPRILLGPARVCGSGLPVRDVARTDPIASDLARDLIEHFSIDHNICAARRVPGLGSWARPPAPAALDAFPDDRRGGARA